MSWTTVRGHRPVEPRYRERPLGDQEGTLIDVPQKCTCGELYLYDCEHVAGTSDRLRLALDSRS